MKIKPVPENPALDAAIARARERWALMTPLERDIECERQRESWARAEAAFGSDADEAEMRAALASGDPARIAAAKDAEARRLARFDRVRGSVG